MIRRTEIALVYGAGLVQGLALVVFAAASDVFTSLSFHGLSSSQYGSLFLPLVVTAIVACTVGGPLARRKGLKLVLLAGLGFDLLSIGILAASPLAVRIPGLAYGSLLFATSALGNGAIRFGTDPETSALDLHCRAHDVDNLYVVDARFFVSSSAVNPGLTIVANALRVGHHLKERLA